MDHSGQFYRSVIWSFGAVYVKIRISNYVCMGNLKLSLEMDWSWSRHQISVTLLPSSLLLHSANIYTATCRTVTRNMCKNTMKPFATPHQQASGDAKIYFYPIKIIIFAAATTPLFSTSLCISHNIMSSLCKLCIICMFGRTAIRPI